MLSDLRLPDHDGLFLLEWMNRGGVCIPFIMMTSYAEIQNAVTAMKKGARDYISKPCQPDMLLEKINDALASRCARPAGRGAAGGEREWRKERHEWLGGLHRGRE